MFLYITIRISENYLNNLVLHRIRKNQVIITVSYLSQMQSLGVVRPKSSQQRYGISEESFNSIQQMAGTSAAEQRGQRISTTPQPQQTVVQETQHASPARSSIRQDADQLTLAQSEMITKLKDALSFQAMQFDRFKELTERKFTTLSKDLLDVTMRLKEAHSHIQKMRDREETASARQALHEYQQGDKPAVTQAIDRNGVAPSSVSIQDIFNCSGRRF